jgi:hypothetical protein
MTRKPRRSRDRKHIENTMAHFSTVAELMSLNLFDYRVTAAHATPTEIRNLRANVKSVARWVEKVVAHRSRRRRDQP